MSTKGKHLNQSPIVQNHQPQPSASAGDIFHGFVYPQHVQSYHIASKANFRLSHSKRKLHPVPRIKEKFSSVLLVAEKAELVQFNSFSSRKTAPCYIITCIPGAFSHMSQRGTSLGSASPTRTCRLASLLHMWTCHSNSKDKLIIAASR